MGSLAFEPFQLPNGTWLKNRIAKAAMEEKLADVKHRNQPSPELFRLYEAWGRGGSGLILSGHIMIDPRANAAPGDVVLAEESGLVDESAWKKWFAGTKSDGAQFWLQINHPGRQIMKGTGLPTYGPSAVAMKMGAISGMFEMPRAMTEDHIQDVIRRFAWTSRKAEELGADGVEIHAAHGYLISQFLSPLTNIRTDKWGGSLENRARLLFEVIKAIRSAVSPSFGVGVKINTADFQRGGFEVDDLYWVVEKMNDMQLDFVEVSGGSYESPAMATGGSTSTKKQAASTTAREAYFLEAAKRIQDIAKMPIMVTGGIRHRETLDIVLSSCDRFLAGVGSAIGLIPDLPNRWARGEDPAPAASDSWVLPKVINAAAKMSSVQYNLHRVAYAQKTWVSVWPVYAFVYAFLNDLTQMGSFKKWMTQDQLRYKDE